MHQYSNWKIEQKKKCSLDSSVFDEEHVIFWKTLEDSPLSASLLWYIVFKSLVGNGCTGCELVSHPQSILEINFIKAKHLCTQIPCLGNLEWFPTTLRSSPILSILYFLACLHSCWITIVQWMFSPSAVGLSQHSVHTGTSQKY